MEALFIYVTCRDAEEAHAIAAALIERKLAACANIMAPHQSVYRWEGKIETGEETAMILKTVPDRFDAVKEVVCQMHSYECPCVVALPIATGHKPFLQWITAQSAPD